MAQKSMHILLLGDYVGVEFLGTTMIRLAHDEMLLVMIPARSKFSISCHAQS